MSLMSNQTTLIITAGFWAIGVIVNLAYVINQAMCRQMFDRKFVRRTGKVWLRLATALYCLYGFALYVHAARGLISPAEMGTLYFRPSIIVIVGLFCSDAIIDWTPIRVARLIKKRDDKIAKILFKSE